MDEKTLISSKRGDVRITVCIVLIIAGIILFALVWTRATSYGFYHDRIADGEWNYVLTSMLPYFASMTLLPMWILAAIFYFLTSCSMTITDKRVYGKAVFGKRVDLPLDSISAVGEGMFGALAVATASGSIRFFDIGNRKEMHEILSKLLIERQDKGKAGPAVASRQDIPQSNADELKKYKDLLDSGVITQAEFDAKKKQLLGL